MYLPRGVRMHAEAADIGAVAPEGTNAGGIIDTVEPQQPALCPCNTRNGEGGGQGRHQVQGVPRVTTGNGEGGG